MLHVRVVSPPGLTGRLVEYLTAEAVNLEVDAPAARLPDGDAVWFDVMRSAANVLADTTGRTGWSATYSRLSASSIARWNVG